MRRIFVVTATQVVTSVDHPEGMLSNVQGFPKYFDSRSYGATEANPDGVEDIALIVAEAEYTNQVKVLTLANNLNRTMWTVTLDRTDGKNLRHKTAGGFPDVTPQPEPEPEPEPNEEPIEE